jgi:hypothetical protein
MNVKEQEIINLIGLIKYFKIKKSIKNALEGKKSYIVTDDKKIWACKEEIEKILSPNIKIMTQTEWLEHVYKRLSPEEQIKIRKKYSPPI